MKKDWFFFLVFYRQSFDDDDGISGEEQGRGSCPFDQRKTLDKAKQQ